MLGPKVAKRLGDGKSLALALAGIPIATLILGLTSSWQIAWIVFAAETFCSMLWNLITVSLRQSIIPGDLMGRVNSVYRMFAWGTIPIATLLGGAIVSIGEHFYSREIALRSTFIIAFVLGSVLFAFAAPRLTSAKIAAAREAGAK
jgi:MFS family permease